MPQMLKAVRLPLITPQYLADKVGKDDVIKACLQCRFVSMDGFICLYAKIPLDAGLTLRSDDVTSGCLT